METSPPLNATLSIEVAQRVSGKSQNAFDIAHKAALLIQGATYIQGFVVRAIAPYQPIEHGWLEVEGAIVDPSLPKLRSQEEELWYFPAQRLSVKQLKAAVEEAQEDYPEDPPLPVYGPAPYEYYGDVMLGGQAYLDAYNQAVVKCKALSQPNLELN